MVKIGGVSIMDYKIIILFDLLVLKDVVCGGGWNILMGKGWMSFGIVIVVVGIVDVILIDVK